MFPQGVQALRVRADGPRNKSGVTVHMIEQPAQQEQV
jgi:hypothetical protein